jgi:hypothetical protein
MSIVFWVLLTISVTLTFLFVFSLTEEVRNFKRTDHVLYQDTPESLAAHDDVAFFGRGMAVTWSLTAVCFLIEMAAKLVCAT